MKASAPRKPALADIATPAPPLHGTPSSLQIFRQFLVRTKGVDGLEHVDASAVHSKACFEAWYARGYARPSMVGSGINSRVHRLASRRSELREPEDVFRRTLTAHVSGRDNRAPFEADEEAAILAVLRQKRPWPAFKDEGFSIGRSGYRAFGFHEKCKSSIHASANVLTLAPVETKRRLATADAWTGREKMQRTTSLPVSAVPQPPAYPVLGAAAFSYDLPALTTHLSTRPSLFELTVALGAFQTTRSELGGVVLDTDAFSLNDDRLARRRLIQDRISVALRTSMLASPAGSFVSAPTLHGPNALGTCIAKDATTQVPM